MTAIPGPDFPTAGFIHGLEGIRQRLPDRPRHHPDAGPRRHRDPAPRRAPVDHHHRAALPGEQGAADREDRRAGAGRSDIEGLSDLRDESDREGIRVVLDVKRGEVPEVILNSLYKLTQMQTTFGIIMLAIVDNQPQGADPQGAAPATSSITARRWSSGAPATTCARPRSGPTSSRACSRRSTISTQVITTIRAEPDAGRGQASG